MKIWEDLLQDIEKNIPSDTECELKMMHSKSALTRFANSQIHQNVDEESADVFLTLHNDSKTVTMSTNLTALKNPKEFVSKAMDSKTALGNPSTTEVDNDKIALETIEYGFFT